MCMPPKRLNLKGYQPFPEDKFSVIPVHYYDLKIDKKIVDRIFEMNKTYTLPVDTYKIYYSFQEENKNDIRISRKHDIFTFISYFPMIVNVIIKQNLYEVQKGRPKVVFICNTPNEAIEVYSMVEKFTEGFNIRVILSHQDRKMQINMDYMKTPFVIFVTTIKNLEYHLQKPSLYFSDCLYLIMVNLSSWSEENQYSVILSSMISCGWSPKKKCRIIATSEMFGYASRDIFSHFSFKHYYDIGV